jgi:hypothetical protein
MAVAQKNMIQLESASKMQFEKELNKLIKRASSSSAKKEYLIDGGRIVKEKARELAPVAKPRLRDRKFKRSNSPVKLSPNVFYTYKKMGQKAVCSICNYNVYTSRLHPRPVAITGLRISRSPVTSTRCHS